MSKILKTFWATIFIIVASIVYSQESDAVFVSKIEWSSDGQQLLVTQQHGGLYLVDPITQSILLELPRSATGVILDASLQPNGNFMVTVDGGVTFNIWDSRNGTLVRSIADIFTPWRVGWSPNGLYLFAGHANQMYLRDATGDELFPMGYGAEDIPIVAFSPDSERLLLSFSAKVEVWDIASQEMLARNIISGLQQSIQWSMDGTKYLAASVSNTREGTFYNIVVVDPMTGERLRLYEGFPEQLTSARWSPDETQILATSVNGTAYLVDAETGDITPIFTGDVPLFSADWSPYGGQVAIGVSTDGEFDARQGEDLTFAEVPVQILVPDPSIERLNAIAELCVCDATTQSRAVTDLTAQPLTTLDTVPEFVAQVEALPEDVIPAACRADLLAVAETLATQQ